MEDRLGPVNAPDILDLVDNADRRVALRDGGGSVSYEDLGASVRTLAGALVRRGVTTGDRVAVSLPNVAAAVEVYLACALIGAIWVGVNPNAPAAERDRQCDVVDPTLIVCNPSGPPRWNGRRVAELTDLAADPNSSFDATPPPLMTACAIGFSSGTTGTPKAVVHSRAGVSLSAAVLADVQLRRDDRIGVILPMSIHNLIVVAALSAMFAGATCIPVERMNAEGVAAACAEYQLTKLNALVPATIYDLVHDTTITPQALSTLRFASTGAAGLSEHLRGAFEEKFGLRLIGSYGMTEAPGAVAIETPDEPHLEGASGRSLPHLRIDATDGRGRRLLARRTGELVVSAREDGAWAGRYRPAMGTWSTAGLHLRPPVEPALRTGDVGWVDDDGTVHVTGRQAEVILRGGVNVNAAELEAVLVRLPDVRDVAVIGVPDERLGQRIVAFVESMAETQLDPAELRTRAREVLSHGKVPDDVVIGTLPRNAMGKVVRGQLTIP
jgi:acyl-CoA synthetase (AMP-forming)/AMP-acid ligase II